MTTFIVKVLETPAELEASFRLRHEVFSGLGYLDEPSASGLEVDEHDRHAIAFAAFDAEGDLVATLRLVTTEVQPATARALDAVVAAAPDLRARARAPRVASVPSALNRRAQEALDHLAADGRPVEELSRTIVEPGQRGRGLSRALMELGLAHALRRPGPPRLVGACLPEHVPMYARYGYDVLPGTGLERNAAVGQLAITVVCDLLRLPERTRSNVAALAAAVAEGRREHPFTPTPEARRPPRGGAAGPVRRDAAEIPPWSFRP